MTQPRFSSLAVLQTYILDSGARQTALLLAHYCVYNHQSAVSYLYRQWFFAGVGRARVKYVGGLVVQKQ